MIQKPKSLVVLVVLLLTAAANTIPADSSEVRLNDLNGIKVALYEGVTDEHSSSLSSRTALFWMFRWMNATVDVVTAADIRNEVLDDYDVIVVPGGWAWAYYQDLDDSGVVKIRRFVENGGAYFGVCAGAYFACDGIRWEGGYIEYSLDIYPNIGVGPVEEIASWPDHNMTKINLNKSANSVNFSSEPDSHMVMYYGGPYFETTSSEGVTTLATYDVNDEPAIVSYEFEQGRVVLSGPHVEWEEDADRDGVAWVNVYDDNGSEWPMMLQISFWLLGISSEASTTTSTTSTTAATATQTTTSTINNTSAIPPLKVEPVVGLVAFGAILIVLVIAIRSRK